MKRFKAQQNFYLFILILSGFLITGCSSGGSDGDHITRGPILGAVCSGADCVDLGKAGSFVILAEAAITDTGSHSSVITGNIGLSPTTGAAIGVRCPEMTGRIYTVDALAAYAGGPGGSADNSCVQPGPGANKTTVDNAVGDMGTAYTDATGRPHGTGASNLNVGGGTLNGQNFVPGTYTWDTPGDVDITGDITITGSATDVWIFQMSGNLNIASGGSVPAGIKVLLAGGAQPQNIFWQVGGGIGATLGTYSTFNGIILSAKQVIMQTGAVFNGRAFAQTEVTLDANPVTAP
ncbi:MAG: ice-binding family protein [Smithellaceae bacterium]|jgi:hypothetical protein